LDTNRGPSSCFVQSQAPCPLLLRKKERKSLEWEQSRRNFASSKGTKRVLEDKTRKEIKHLNINN
jgi:hypothetical protein